MKEKVHIFFRKHGIETPEIMYVVRSDRKTVVHLEDGRTEESYIALKDIVSVLPEDEFLHINKGTVVSKRHIIGVEKGIYLMSDGTSFQGRMRTPGEHTRNGMMVSSFRDRRKTLYTDRPAECFTIMDQLPLAFMVIELVHEDAETMRLYIRFCSREAGKVLGVDPGLVVDEPLRKIFPFISNNLVIKIGDIAANGGRKDMVVRDSRIRSDLFVRCFQTRMDFCAVAITDMETIRDADRI